MRMNEKPKVQPRCQQQEGKDLAGSSSSSRRALENSNQHSFSQKHHNNNKKQQQQQHTFPTKNRPPFLSHQILKSFKNLDFALFLSFLPVIYHSSQFALARVPALRQKPTLRAFIAGSLSALSIAFDITRARDLATYFSVRCISEFIMHLNDRGIVASLPHADALLFCTVLMVIMSTFVYAPSLFRPLYYRLFLRFEGKDRFIVKYARYSFREYVWRKYLGPVHLWLKEQEEEMRKRGHINQQAQEQSQGNQKHSKPSRPSSQSPELKVDTVNEEQSSQRHHFGFLEQVPPTPVNLALPDAREIALVTYGSPLRHKTPPPE